jgi:putative transcriptional regulator
MRRGRQKILPIAEGNRVFELRTARGWSQEHLAELLDCHGTTVQRAESGQRGLSDGMRVKLAKVFGVSEGELFAAAARYGTPLEEEAARLARSMAPEELDAWLHVGRALAKGSKRRNVA